MNAFVGELRNRCATLSEEDQPALVLELFAQDVQLSLDGAVAEKRQALIRFLEGLWDKYRVTLSDLRGQRADAEQKMNEILRLLRFQ
jgi:type I restriction enzyme M protein